MYVTFSYFSSHDSLAHLDHYVRHRERYGLMGGLACLKKPNGPVGLIEAIMQGKDIGYDDDGHIWSVNAKMLILYPRA